MKVRNLVKIVAGTHQTDGAGVHLVRVIGLRDTKDFDPFLMLDAFDSRDPADYIKGFPWHPHRGIETVTYLIKGKIEHRDSLNNSGVINSGECQWMTAGSGILHQEMPRAVDHMLGLQLWINLPRKDKMTRPRYFDIRNDMIAEVKEDDATVRVIAGAYKGKKGVESRFVEAHMFDIEVKPGKGFRMPVDSKLNAFAYIVDGSGRFGDDSAAEIPRRAAVLLEREGDFQVKAGEEGVRLVLFAGEPLNEPIAWGGPIVMNTREELNLAFDELEEGTFIKK